MRQQRQQTKGRRLIEMGVIRWDVWCSISKGMRRWPNGSKIQCITFIGMFTAEATIEDSH